MTADLLNRRQASRGAQALHSRRNTKRGAKKGSPAPWASFDRLQQIGLGLGLQMFSRTLRKFSEKASFSRRKFFLCLAIVLCGLSSLAMAQGTPVPKRVTADQRNAPNVAADQTNAPGVVSYPQPPAGFDPLTASDKELTRYGFPPRPDPEKAPEAYAHWQKLVSVPRIANPTLQQTTIYNGPAQHVPTKREP